MFYFNESPGMPSGAKLEGAGPGKAPVTLREKQPLRGAMPPPLQLHGNDGKRLKREGRTQIQSGKHAVPLDSKGHRGCETDKLEGESYYTDAVQGLHFAVIICTNSS